MGTGQHHAGTGKIVGLESAVCHLFGRADRQSLCSRPVEAGTSAGHARRRLFWGMGMRPYFHYEYKSKRTLFGLPLVHIHLGWGFCHAKGVLAIGNVATGLFAFGGVALGLFALGGVSLGLLALGGLALALLAAVGGLAIGAIAVGGLAVGLLALGGLAVGVYAMGGAAIASQIAAGDYAQAAVAIGNSVLGDRTFAPGELSTGQLAAQLKEFLPQTPDWILNLFAPFCSR